jgi:hypothetical protein
MSAKREFCDFVMMRDQLPWKGDDPRAGFLTLYREICVTGVWSRLVKPTDCFPEPTVKDHKPAENPSKRPEIFKTDEMSRMCGVDECSSKMCGKGNVIVSDHDPITVGGLNATIPRDVETIVSTHFDINPVWEALEREVLVPVSGDHYSRV